MSEAPPNSAIAMAGPIIYVTPFGTQGNWLKLTIERQGTEEEPFIDAAIAVVDAQGADITDRTKNDNLSGPIFVKSVNRLAEVIGSVIPRRIPRPSRVRDSNEVNVGDDVAALLYKNIGFKLIDCQADFDIDKNLTPELDVPSFGNKDALGFAPLGEGNSFEERAKNRGMTKSDVTEIHKTLSDCMGSRTGKLYAVGMGRKDVLIADLTAALETVCRSQRRSLPIDTRQYIPDKAGFTPTAEYRSFVAVLAALPNKICNQLLPGYAPAPAAVTSAAR